MADNIKIDFSEARAKFLVQDNAVQGAEGRLVIVQCDPEILKSKNPKKEFILTDFDQKC